MGDDSLRLRVQPVVQVGRRRRASLAGRGFVSQRHLRLGIHAMRNGCHEEGSVVGIECVVPSF